eukprot:TRINITY_DN7840_c0_g1_i3.p1 TRINITY_DN7840_c0_g1~~TRINITY_DN7840_c0_g1_i3.p1  ORF type:complete len:655 (-),score=133.65 TRINITY_DN7840_c0_g1_i3:322-2286(-)
MSLRKVCRELVLDDLLHRASATSDCAAHDVARMQIVVDESSMRVLNSFLRMGDLHAEGVTSLELLQRTREALPDLDALYILRPDSANIDLLLGDFSAGAQPQHRQVHLAFSQPVPEDLLGRLAENAQLAPRVKSLVEIPLSFLSVQDRGFHLDAPNALTALFPSYDHLLVSQLARQLADVCRCLRAYAPTIRHAQSDLCRSVAERFQEELQRCRRSRDSQVPCHFLVLDRSVDMAATLVHEYTYECMVYDLLDGRCFDAEKGIVTLPSREVLLSDADPLWEELRHLHLLEVQSHLQALVEEVKAQDHHQSASALSTTQMLEMLRKTPEQKERIGRLELHLFLNEQINLRLQEDQVTSMVGPLEQDIACGIDASGKDVKPSNLLSTLSKVLGESQVSSEVKLRLLALFYASMTNISEVARQKLMELANLDAADQYVLMGMVRAKLMEVPAGQRHKQDKGSTMVHRVTKEQAARFKAHAKTEGRFALSRFEPRVRDLLERLADQRLSDADYPTLAGSGGGGGGGLRDAASGGAGAAPVPAAPSTLGDIWSFDAPAGAGGSAASSSAAEAAAEAEVTRRLVVFVLGGITHSELRAVAELSATLPRSTAVYLGGTAVLTPRRLLETLRGGFAHAASSSGAGAGDAGGASDALAALDLA